jgi:hypothetical protein
MHPEGHNGIECSKNRLRTITPNVLMTENRVELILALFRRLGELDTKIDFEPSFKAEQGKLFENRFLLGIHRNKSINWNERVAHICSQSGMPPNLLAAFQQTLPDANYVYLGVERNDRTLIFKVYSEFRDKIKAELAAGRGAGRAHLLYSGFKWDTASPTRQAVTEYAWYPSLPLHHMHEHLRTFIEPSRHRELLGLAEGVTVQAAEKIPGDDIQFLEVTEKGNPRRSFDINVYKSGLTVGELFPHLLPALRHYAIAEEKIESLFQRIGKERFGHLAGGIGRDNRDFMTVYYGAREIHSSQLGAARAVPANNAT